MKAHPDKLFCEVGANVQVGDDLSYYGIKTAGWGRLFLFERRTRHGRINNSVIFWGIAGRGLALAFRGATPAERREITFPGQRSVLITGGSRGIGLSRRQLAGKGQNLRLAERGTSKRLERRRAELRRIAGRRDLSLRAISRTGEEELAKHSVHAVQDRWVRSTL